MALLNLCDSGQITGVNCNSFRAYPGEITYPYTKWVQPGVLLSLCNLIFINFLSSLSFTVCYFFLLSACLAVAVYSPSPIQLAVSALLLTRELANEVC